MITVKSGATDLNITRAVKDRFEHETNDSVRRQIQFLINWREQSLKCEKGDTWT